MRGEAGVACAGCACWSDAAWVGVASAAGVIPASGLKPSSNDRLSARALAGWRGVAERCGVPRGVKNEDIIIPSTKNCTVSEASE